MQNLAQQTRSFTDSSESRLLAKAAALQNMQVAEAMINALKSVLERIKVGNLISDKIIKQSVSNALESSQKKQSPKFFKEQGLNFKNDNLLESKDPLESIQDENLWRLFNAYCHPDGKKNSEENTFSSLFVAAQTWQQTVSKVRDRGAEKSQQILEKTDDELQREFYHTLYNLYQLLITLKNYVKRSNSIMYGDSLDKSNASQKGENGALGKEEKIKLFLELIYGYYDDIKNVADKLESIYDQLKQKDNGAGVGLQDSVCQEGITDITVALAEIRKQLGILREPIDSFSGEAVLGVYHEILQETFEFASTTNSTSTTTSTSKKVTNSTNLPFPDLSFSAFQPNHSVSGEASTVQLEDYQSIERIVSRIRDLLVVDSNSGIDFSNNFSVMSIIRKIEKLNTRLLPKLTITMQGIVEKHTVNDEMNEFGAIVNAKMLEVQNFQKNFMDEVVKKVLTDNGIEPHLTTIDREELILLSPKEALKNDKNFQQLKDANTQLNFLGKYGNTLPIVIYVPGSSRIRMIEKDETSATEAKLVLSEIEEPKERDYINYLNNAVDSDNRKNLITMIRPVTLAVILSTEPLKKRLSDKASHDILQHLKENSKHDYFAARTFANAKLDKRTNFSHLPKAEEIKTSQEEIKILQKPSLFTRSKRRKERNDKLKTFLLGRDLDEEQAKVNLRNMLSYQESIPWQQMTTEECAHVLSLTQEIKDEQQNGGGGVQLDSQTQLNNHIAKEFKKPGRLATFINNRLLPARWRRKSMHERITEEINQLFRSGESRERVDLDNADTKKRIKALRKIAATTRQNDLLGLLNKKLYKAIAQYRYKPSAEEMKKLVSAYKFVKYELKDPRLTTFAFNIFKREEDIYSSFTYSNSMLSRLAAMKSFYDSAIAEPKDEDLLGVIREKMLHALKSTVRTQVQALQSRDFSHEPIFLINVLSSFYEFASQSNDKVILKKVRAIIKNNSITSFIVSYISTTGNTKALSWWYNYGTTHKNTEILRAVEKNKEFQRSKLHNELESDVKKDNNDRLFTVHRPKPNNILVFSPKIAELKFGEAQSIDEIKEQLNLSPKEELAKVAYPDHLAGGVHFNRPDIKEEARKLLCQRSEQMQDSSEQDSSDDASDFIFQSVFNSCHPAYADWQLRSLARKIIDLSKNKTNLNNQFVKTLSSDFLLETLINEMKQASKVDAAGILHFMVTCQEYAPVLFTDLLQKGFFSKEILGSGQNSSEFHDSLLVSFLRQLPKIPDAQMLSILLNDDNFIKHYSSACESKPELAIYMLQFTYDSSGSKGETSFTVDETINIVLNNDQKFSLKDEWKAIIKHAFDYCKQEAADEDHKKLYKQQPPEIAAAFCEYEVPTHTREKSRNEKQLRTTTMKMLDKKKATTTGTEIHAANQGNKITEVGVESNYRNLTKTIK